MIHLWFELDCILVWLLLPVLKSGTFSLLPWFHPFYWTKKPFLTGCSLERTDLLFLEETRRSSLDVPLWALLPEHPEKMHSRRYFKRMAEICLHLSPLRRNSPSSKLEAEPYERFPKTLGAHPDLWLMAIISLLTFFLRLVSCLHLLVVYTFIYIYI